MAIPFLTVDNIIERALFMIRDSEKFKNTKVFDSTSGLPIKINKLRSFGGFDGNQEGITLSIIPYTYEGTSNETVHSTNIAVKYTDYELGNAVPRGSNGGRVRATVSLLITLQTVGFLHEIESSTPLDGVVVERSQKERALYKWGTLVWDLLLSNPLQNLGGLVRNSTVNWLSFKTSKWSEKTNAVLHEARLLWSLEIFCTRDYKQFIKFNEDLTPTWYYVGVRSSDEVLVYWDVTRLSLMSVNGNALTLTPRGDRVVWDPAETRFESPVDGNPLTTFQLEDPSLTPIKPWIRTEIKPVGVVLPSNRILYWNSITMQLEYFDGTVVINLEDGTPIVFNPNTGQVINTTTSQPIQYGNNFIPTYTSQVNIYSSRTKELIEKFNY